MKTIDEAAHNYKDSLKINSNNVTIKQIEEYAIQDFMEGVKFAQRWIPIEEELPPINTYLLLKHKGHNKYFYNTLFFEVQPTTQQLKEMLIESWRLIELE